MSTDRNDDLILSLYKPDEREAIERWLAQAPVNTGMKLEDACRVSELALCSVRDQLPQWWAMRKDGHLLIGRRIPLRAVRRIDGLLKPVFLCEINWADSGPGYSWPECYYATPLPGYNLVVVTASQDSPDAYGYADIAIGYFAAGGDIGVNAETLIEGWWRAMYDAYGQEAWEEELGSGDVDPWNIRGRVWTELEDDEELEDDGDE